MCHYTQSVVLIQSNVKGLADHAMDFNAVQCGSSPLRLVRERRGDDCLDVPAVLVLPRQAPHVVGQYTALEQHGHGVSA